MPASITHELIARECSDHLPADARRIIQAAFGEYILGAQGPDLFFFYRPLPRRKQNFGGELHRGKVYPFLSALASACKKERGEALGKCLAYCLGFCSHIAADAVFHPFVYNYLAEYGEDGHAHQRIENDWDVYFLRELDSSSPVGHEYPFDMKNIAREATLYPMLAEAFSALGQTLQERDFSRMCALFSRYLTHFHRRGARPLGLFGFGAFYPRPMPDPDVLGGMDFPRLSGNGIRSADGLFLAAVEESAACIEGFLESFKGGTPLPRTLLSRDLRSGAAC